MNKKLLYSCLLIVICVSGYVIIKSYDFHKYFNKLEINNSKPLFKIENLLGTNELKINYLKSVNYGKKCIAYTAIINDKYYISVVKLGKVTSTLGVSKILKDFNESNIITIPLIDAEQQIGCYVNFENYPFSGKKVKYYIHGKEIQTLNEQFSEVVFKGDYINFSFEGNRKDFGFVTPKEEMSVSFVVYKNELYVINMKSYRSGYPFTSLHSLLK